MQLNLQKACVFFLLFLSFNTSGQLIDEESAPSELISEEPSFSHQYTYLHQNNYYFIDTTFNNLQWYHQWNNANQDLFNYAVLGNMGSALNPLTVMPRSDIWSYYDLKAYKKYFNDMSTIPFYYTRSPLTEAVYWMGYNRGQNFKIYHTQNINKYWNFLVQYKRLNSLGFYNHNNNRQSSFLINTRYDNPEWGYTAAAYAISEKLEIQEFGGLPDDSVFINNLEPNRVLLDVNLPNDLRVMRNREFYLDQKIKLARLLLVATATEDSLAEGRKDKAYLAVGHDIKYTRRSDVYKGQSANYYDNYFYTEAGYSDSSSYRSLTNTLYLEAQVGQKSNINIKGGMRNLLTEYAGKNFQFITNNWGIAGDLNGRVSDLIDVNGMADFIIAGPLNGSVNLYGHGKVRLYKKINASASYQYQLKNPGFYEQFYYSNNYIWQNTFDKEARGILKYGLAWGNGNKLEASNFTFNNYTYYDSTGSPAQSDQVVKAVRLELVQNFTFWNFLHLDNRVYYQTTTDANGVLPLPEWVTRNALYFQFPLFRGALQCLVGAEAKYFSSYYSPGFNPATGEFFISRERLTGDYPLLDVFANFKIKKAKVFVKYEHANAGFLTYDYFAAPGYPFPDGVLRVGISWRFFN